MSALRRSARCALAFVIACAASVAVRAQTQDPGVLAEQLIAAMLQGGTQVSASPGAAAGATPEPGAGAAATASPRPPPAPLPPQIIYRYRDPSGRDVYTNVPDRIPLDEREGAKVDLSHISLNSELGAELNRRLEQRYERLVTSPRCEQLLREANLGFVERMWQDYAPLIVCGGVLLLFVLFTPSALRRFGGPIWSRTLMMAIPALAIGGVLTYSMRETGQAIIELKHQAEPCARGTFAGLGSAPNALQRRIALVRQLQAMALPSGSAGALPQ